MSENRTTDAPRDPAFPAVARVLDAEKAFTAAVATVATTPAGLAVITGFIREVTRQIGDAYFQDGEAVMFADSLDAAVRGIAGLPPRVA